MYVCSHLERQCDAGQDGHRSVRASQGVLVVNNLPANKGDIRDVSLIPGLGRSLEKDMATHSRILTWRIPWTEEPGRL